MNARFDTPLSLTNGRLTVAARGPIDWAPDDESAVIENVRIKRQGVTASSLLSVTVTPANNRWSLDASSSAQLAPGQADAYAYVTATRTDGTHYHPQCYNDVRLQP
jgi:hypothetical protein